MTRPAALLPDFDEQRDALARSLRDDNPRLDGPALGELTNNLLARLIFLRLLADAQIEPDALTRIAASKSPWAAFQAACRRLDRIYDPPVAQPQLDRLAVDAAMFAALCRRLAPGGSRGPLPPGILGDMHERSLGQVIAIRGRDAHFVARPGPRRSAGAYYTPAHIVRLLVDESVGPLIANKTPEQLAELRVCDLSCGGGAFLLGVYERLLAAHEQWYEHHPEDALRAGCVRRDDGSLALSLPQRQAILVANIFGVDIDPQAVAIARRTLYLKLLAGHTPIDPVPTLGRNIVCADALRRDDHPTVEQLFPAVIRSGGFDAIVGNPPYVRPHNLSAPHKRQLWADYPAFKAKADLYACFIQRSTALLRPGGQLGYIVARGWLALDSFDVLRRHILDSYRVLQLIELPARVFAEAQVETIALVFQRELEAKARDRNVIAVNTLVGERVQPQRTIPQQAFATTYANVFDLSIEPATEVVKSLMRQGPSLGSLYDIVFGLKTGDDAKFIHTRKGYHKDDQPLLRGDDIRRYGHTWNGEYVWYVPDKMRAHRSTARPGEAARFEQPKVLVKDTSKELGATWEDGTHYVKDVLIVLPRPDHPTYDLKALLGILNSQAMRFYYRSTFPTLHVQTKELASLPLPRFDLASKSGRAAHDALVALVDQRLELEATSRAARTDAAKHQQATRIRSLERRIDALVYTHFGLDTAAIETLESALARTTAAPD